MGVPEGWTQMSFGDFCTLKRGYDLPVGERQAGNVPIFAANGVVGTHNEAKVQGPGVVTGRSGTIGKVAFVPQDFWPLNTALYAQDMHGNDAGFVYRFIEGFRLEQFSTGTGVPTLNRNLVHQEIIAVPPIWEQRKIAAILSSVDEAIEKKQAVIDQVQVVKKGLMQELLTRGLPGRHKEFKQTEIGEIPAEWEVVQLGQVARISSGGTPDRAIPEYWGGSIPWVKTGEIKRCAIRMTSEHITDLGLNNSAAKIFPPGTVLMAMYGQGQTRGRVGWLDVPACTNQACAAIEPDSKISRRFVYHFLDHHYEAIRTIGNEGSQKNLNISLIKSISIPLMSNDEQSQIADLADAHDVRIVAEGTLLSGLQTLKQSLMSNLLTGTIRVTP